MNLFCCTILPICECMYDCLTDLMVVKNLTIVNKTQSKGQALPNKAEQIKGWRNDEKGVARIVCEAYKSVKKRV